MRSTNVTLSHQFLNGGNDLLRHCYSIDKSNKITEQDADALFTNCIESVVQINRNDQTSVNNLKTNIKLQSKRKKCLSSCLYDVHCLVNIVAVS